MKNAAFPTNEQMMWHDMELGMFIHWAPYVYNEPGVKNLTPPLEAIEGVDFDCEGWVQTAIDMGAKYIVFVAKHTGGFCLWQTDTTPYSVRNISWRGGRGDVLRDLSELCRKRGLRLGVYLSPADIYMNVKVGGCAETPQKQEEYNEIYRRQLREVLDNYGDILEIWFDGSTICPIKDILDEHPGVIVFNSRHANIRWVGNEMGTARYPAWNGVRAEDQPLLPTRDAGTPDGEAWMPLECDTTIREGWFWTPDNEKTLKSLETLLRTWYVTVGHGAVLLLNSNPDRTGHIPQADAQRAREFGDLLSRIQAGKLAATSGEGWELTLRLSRPQPVDHISLAEDIRLGERVRAFRLEGLSDGIWRVLANGSAIGHRHIIRLAGKECFEVLRLHIDSASDVPHIRELAACYAELPIHISDPDYEPARDLRVYEWDESIFYGVPLTPRMIEINLSDSFSGASDVGWYEMRLNSARGGGRIIEAAALCDGAVLDNYIQPLDETRVRLYVPGVDLNYCVRLTVEFDAIETEGVILLRKE